MTPRPPRARRLRRTVALIGALAILGAVLGTVAIATNAFGAGSRWESVVARVDRFIAGPVPTRSAPVTVRVTEPPLATPAPLPSASAPTGSSAPASAPPTATPEPIRTPVDVDILDDPEAFFVSQDHKDWCAVAGTQMVLAIHGRADTSVAFQRELASRVREWESYDDSHNGDWGPGAMSLALDAYGVPGYEVRAFETRGDALRDAARAIEATGAPVILLAWRGAHTWVMTGFRASADPSVFRDARIEGTYILDPWYPRISSIWGASDPAGTFQDADEMARNFLKWKRPEGRYPDRDGSFITVAPTIALTDPG